MASLQEPIEIDKAIIKQIFAEMLNKYPSDPGTICETALSYYQNHIRDDLIVFPERITLGDYSYFVQRIAYRKNEGDYVVFSQFVDSVLCHDHGDGMVFDNKIKDDEYVYNWVCYILDRRSFHSKEDLLTYYRKECGSSCSGGFILFVAPSVTEANTKRDQEMIAKVEAWMSEVESEDLVAQEREYEGNGCCCCS